MGFEVNVSEVFNQFKELTFREMDSAVKRAMRRAAKAIKDQTVSNARAGIKTYNNHPNDPYHGDSILDAPRITKLQDRYDGELEIKVHVLGSTRDDSQTYRFRFLEAGTKPRYAKTFRGKPLQKSRYLGQITGRRYFDNARRSVDVENIYLETFSKAVENINNGG